MADLTEAQTRALHLHEQLWNDRTEAGAAYRKKAKEAYPEITTPEDVAEPAVAPYRAQVEAQQKVIDELLADKKSRDEAAEAAKLQGDLEGRLNAARDKYRLDSAAFDKMVERMKETGNFGDAEAAALWVMSQNPPPSQERGAGNPAWLDSKLNLFGSAEYDEKMAKLHTRPQDFMDDGLREFVRDPDAYVAEDQRLRPLGLI